MPENPITESCWAKGGRHEVKIQCPFYLFTGKRLCSVFSELAITPGYRSVPLRKHIFMSGKLIAQRIESRRSARLIQQKDGNAIYWVLVSGQPHKQTVLPVEKRQIEETIKNLGLETVGSFSL